MRTAKILIRLGGCPGWSDSSPVAQVILLVLSWGGSYAFECYFCNRLRLTDTMMVLRPRQGNLRQVFRLFKVSCEAFLSTRQIIWKRARDFLVETSTPSFIFLFFISKARKWGSYFFCLLKKTEMQEEFIFLQYRVSSLKKCFEL